MENDLLPTIYSSFFSTFVFIVLYNTNVIVEYFKYLPFVRQKLKIKDFLEYQNLTGDTTLLYIQYLASTYNNFFIKLISCPLCLGFWINLVSSLYLSNPEGVFISYTISVILYTIFKKNYDPI
jgi:hypothetical protein